MRTHIRMPNPRYAMANTGGRGGGARHPGRCVASDGRRNVLLLIVCILGACTSARAVPVELRLVVHDKPEITLDKVEMVRPIVNPVSTSSGVEMRKIGLELVCWARNVRLDGQPVFERYYEGKYIDRLPVARPDLQPGDHTIWPGNHVFSISKDGTVSSKAPDLIVEGKVIKIKCYPVTVRAVRATPDEEAAEGSLGICPLPNLTIWESGNAEEAAAKPEARLKIIELLPAYDKFAPLTIWLPGNKIGKGYLIHPVGLTFHLGPEGVLAGAGGGQRLDAVRVEKNLVEIALHGFPVSGTAGSKVIIPGVEEFTWSERDAGMRQFTSWYPRKAPYEFTVSEAGPSVRIDGDLRILPVKSMKVGMLDPLGGAQWGLVVEMATRHLSPGGRVKARIRAIDTSEALGVYRAAKEARAATGRTLAALRSSQAKLAEISQGLRIVQEGKLAEEAAKQKLAEMPSAAEAAKVLLQKSLEEIEVARTRASDALKSLETARSREAATERLLNALRLSEPSAPAIATVARAAETLKAGVSSQTPAAEVLKTLDELQTRINDALGKLDQAIEAFEDTELPVKEAVATMNPLERAAPVGRIRAYGGEDWTDVQIEPSGSEWLVSIPNLPNGVYHLRLGVRPSRSPGEPIFVEEYVSVASDEPASVGVFTQRGRRAFFRGESFWIAVAVLALKGPLPIGQPIVVDMVDSRGQRFALVREKTPRAIEKRETFIVRLDAALSLDLAPGRYRVEARVGSWPARPIWIDISEPEPQTHFTNLLNGKYNVLGARYADVLRNGEGADELACGIVNIGYNAFMGMSYDVNRVYRANTEVERVVRERPEIGPWETYYQPSGRDRFMDACVRANLRFYENLFTYNDTMLPREPRILDACERYASLEVSAMRHNPAFRGVCLYDEFYGSADTGTAMSQLFYKAQEVTFRAKHKGLTSAEALKALDRFTGRPFGQRRQEDLAKFRTWPAHEDSLWRDFSTRMASAVKDVMPTSQNFAQQRFWGGNGGNIAANGTPDDVFDSLDAATCVMYKDGGVGDRPVFAPMQVDVLRTRDHLPVWTQLHTFSGPPIYGKHILRQAFFGLSQKPDGFSFFTIQVDPGNPSYIDNRDTVQDIAKRLCTPYGDLFLALERGYKKVAVYYSREADYLASRKPNNLQACCEGLWVACIRAGFPADFLYDRQIREGRGMDYEVIFAPGFFYEDEASPEILAALRRLVSAGKTVVVERSSKLPVEGIVRLDSELDEYDDKLGGAFPRYIDFETEMVWDQSEETTKLLRDFLSKRIPPAAKHDLLVGPDWLRCGDAEYMVIPNLAFTRFTGLYKTLYQAPDCPTLRFPKRPPVCYDMLEMKRVPVTTEGDWMTLRADLRAYPGKIYAFLPAEIGRLSLRSVPSPGAGTDLHYAVSVLDAQGKAIRAGFPIQITLRDPAGALYHEVYRAAVPEYRGTYRLPANAPAGTWKLSVRELISGAAAEATLDVGPGRVGPATLDTATVRIHDPERLERFLSVREEILIGLDDGQAWCRPHAERLCRALLDRGRKARIVSLDEVIRLPSDWDAQNPVIDGSRLWRGDVVNPGLLVDAPLILIGRRRENRLIEALLCRDVLPEPLTDSFPGPGRAVVDWTRRAFSTHYDTVTILSNDEAGLSRGIAVLVGSDRALASPVRPTVLTPEPNPAVRLEEAKTGGRVPSSYRDSISTEDLIRTIDVDPASGRILVGTFGFGHNLFCFAPDGELVWKQFLPEHNVYFARWCTEERPSAPARRIAAATGQGFFFFILDAADGRVLKKFAATEWPSFHYQEGAVNTELQIILNPPLRQVLIRGLTGIMAVDYEGNKMWHHDRAEAIASYPKEAEQTLAAAFPITVHVGNIAASPDGQKLAYSEERIIGSTPGDVPGAVVDLWQHTPKVLDARTGRVLLTNTQDPGNQKRPGNWWVTWPADSSVPFVNTGNLSAPIGADGKIGAYTLREGNRLKHGGKLLITRTDIRRLDRDGRIIWKLSSSEGALAPRLDTQLQPAFSPPWVLELDRLNEAETRLYRSNADGVVRCIDMSSGRTLWENKLPFSAILCPVKDELIAGANNGTLARFDASGKRLWETRLRDHHELPQKDYAGYIQAARLRDPDSTPEFFPVGLDKPGEYDSVLRMGLEQLQNGGFETLEGWSEGARCEPPGRSGKRSLTLRPGQLVTQRVKRKVVPSATYLLEFFYRVDGDRTRLTAGVLLGGAKETLTASKFRARPDEWTFGRLAVKSLADTVTLDVGFEAEAGEIRIDDVSLRPVRFPSANLLANAGLHAIEPTFVKDPRVQYERIPGSLRDKLMGLNHVVGFKQGMANTATIYLEEEAYLHNGRLDDVGPVWVYMPDSMGFSIVLTKPAYVSHVVLYLNNATPDNTYETICVLANNLDTGTPEDVALIRGNRRRFVVVHFPKPLYTDSIKLLPAMHGGRRECLTEVEVYGPLGGPSIGVHGKGFTDDPDATPMFMGAPAHVPARLPPDLVGEYVETGRMQAWQPAFGVGATVADGLLTYAEASGVIRSVKMPAVEGDKRLPMQWGPNWAASTITPTTTPARYAGRLLVGSADGKLHAVSDAGTKLWAFQTGGRVCSCPTPTGDEVYFGSDDGKLYKVDVDSGILIWEFATGDKVRSAPALAGGRVYAASWDGYLYAVDAESGLAAWKAPLAKYTRSSPVVRGDRVYIGDEQGRALCFSASNGSLIYLHEIGGYISACPVVSEDGAFYASEQGDIAFVGHDGSLRWKQRLPVRVTGQPVGTQTQIVLPTEKGVIVIRRADGRQDDRFVPPEPPGKVISALPYGDRLCLVAASAGTSLVGTRWYASYSALLLVWEPKSKIHAPVK